MIGWNLLSRMRLVVLGKERDSVANLTGSTSTTDAVDVILNSKRELFESSQQSHIW